MTPPMKTPNEHQFLALCLAPGNVDEAQPRHTASKRKPGRCCNRYFGSPVCAAPDLFLSIVWHGVVLLCGQPLRYFLPRSSPSATTFSATRRLLCALDSSAEDLSGSELVNPSLKRLLSSDCSPLKGIGVLPGAQTSSSVCPPQGWSVMSTEECEEAALGVPYEPLPR